jgi:hypothetical protein
MKRRAIIETTWVLVNRAQLPRDWLLLTRKRVAWRKRFLSCDRPKVFAPRQWVLAYHSPTEREKGNRPGARDAIKVQWTHQSTKEYVHTWSINNHLKV